MNYHQYSQPAIALLRHKYMLAAVVAVAAIAAAGVLVARAESLGSLNCTPGTCYVQQSGSHITIVGLWKAGNYIETLLHATLNMDTHIATDAGPICEAGDMFEINITSTGELTGYATAYFDSPPITFHDDHTVVAVTEGVIQRSCRIFPTNTCDDFDAELTDFQKAQINKPLLSRWEDSWQATIDGQAAPLTCQTLSATSAKCTFSDTVTVPINLTLTRQLDNFDWELADPTQYSRGPEFTVPLVMKPNATVDCKPKKPNLTVIDLKNTPANPVPGETIAVEANILSNGVIATTQSTTAIAQFDRGADGTWDETLEPRDVPPLAVGAKHPVAWFDTWVMTPGTHRYRVCVDPDDLIMELDETEEDNCEVKVLNIPDIANPDLIAETLTTAAGLQVGAATQVSALIKNIGDQPAAASNAALLVTTASGTAIPGTAAVPELAPGAAHLVNIAWTPAVVGPQTILICADHGNALVEKNEDNNCVSRTVIVAAAPLTTTPTPTPSPAAQAENAIIPGPVRETD